MQSDANLVPADRQLGNTIIPSVCGSDLGYDTGFDALYFNRSVGYYCPGLIGYYAGDCRKCCLSRQRERGANTKKYQCNCTHLAPPLVGHPAIRRGDATRERTLTFKLCQY